MVREEKAATLLQELHGLQLADQAERIRSVDPGGHVLVELADEATRLTSADAPRAIESTELIRSLADHLGVAMARCRARRGLARALAYAGRLEEALVACDEAIAIAESHGLDVEAGRARLASMHALTELGRLDAALVVGTEAQQLFDHLGEAAMSARADINLGIVHQRRDDPASAVACFDRALPRISAEPTLIGHLENNRGEALLALGDFRGAEQAFAAALGMNERAGSSLAAAVADGNLADVAARQGHLDRALFHFERARRRLETGGSRTHLARLLTEQAEAKAILGLPAEALDEFEAALPELDASGLALEAARARAGIGMTMLRLGRLADAHTPLAAAATGFEELGHATARARVDLIRAELFLLDERLDEARQLALRAMGVLMNRPADAVAARAIVSRVAMAAGDLMLATNELNTAVAEAERLDLPPLLADLLHARGSLHRRRGGLSAAVTDLQAAVAAVERVRGSLQADRLRAAYLGRRASIYEALVEALLQRSGAQAIASAFAVVEQARSRALLDQLGGLLHHGGHGPAEADHEEARLQERLDEVQGRLNGLYSRMAEDESRGPCGELRTHIRQTERELDGLTARLSVTSGEAGLMAPTRSLEDVQTVIGEGSALLEYACIGEEILAFVVTAHHATVHRHLTANAAVAHHLARLRFQIDRALRPGAESSRRFGRMVTDTLEQLAALWDLLIAPVESALAGADHLTIVPHGPLHLVPFHALWDRERHLLQSRRVRYAPSASVLHHLARTRRTTGPAGQAVVVGIGDADAPHIEHEAAAVMDALGGADHLLLGRSASVKAFTGVSRHARLIHLACHGRFSADAPMSSGLRLADRWLTVRDIFRLRLDADLVTLSGCETGINSVTAGDELMGLLRGFFAAGARSLLVSLWRAHDEATAEFMGRFYEAWSRDGRGDDKCGILTDVQLAMMHRWEHPAYWAPFIVVGKT